ncbi:hypothetical protein MRX96_057413 [Rhipicephalus microplus]
MKKRHIAARNCGRPGSSSPSVHGQENDYRACLIAPVFLAATSERVNTLYTKRHPGSGRNKETQLLFSILLSSSLRASVLFSKPERTLREETGAVRATLRAELDVRRTHRLFSLSTAASSER